MNYFSQKSVFEKNIKGTDSNNYNEKFEKNASLLEQTITQKRLFESKYNISRTFSDGKTVVLNTLYDSIVVLNSDETQLFKSNINTVKRPHFLAKLYLLGILIEEGEDEASLLDFLVRELPFNPNGVSTIMILPTLNCNARCSYCFEQDRLKEKMSDETISNVIDFFADNFSENDHVLIRWFGGEPLLACDVIDKITEGLNTRFNNNLFYESTIVTNGSLLSNEIINSATNNWNVTKVQVTLDGYGDEHNRRKNFPKASIDYYNKTLSDIEKLISSNIFTVCRVNFDKTNLRDIDSILESLSPFKYSNLFLPRFTILRPSECGYNEFSYITPREYKETYSYIYNKLYEYGFLTAVKDLIPHRKREICLAKSINKAIIGPDGSIYKCLQEGFNKNTAVGNLTSGVSFSQYNNYCQISLESECRKCLYLPWCMGGCPVYRKMSKTREVTPCIRERYFIDVLMEMVHKWEFLK